MDDGVLPRAQTRVSGWWPRAHYGAHETLHEQNQCVATLTTGFLGARTAARGASGNTSLPDVWGVGGTASTAPLNSLSFLSPPLLLPFGGNVYFEKESGADTLGNPTK